MICVGIEGTAHTLGVGVVTGEGAILANVADMLRPETGGIHPREAATHHASLAPDLLDQALAKAGVGYADVSIVAFSQGPGLGPCLRAAATAARSLAASLEVPLLGVNHCVAHLEIGRLVTEARDPLLLYVSGGNTQVIALRDGRYRVFGETLDVGVGNALDKFAREQGIPFPGGPRVEALARAGDRLLPLPYTIKGMDVAFSGLVTAATKLAAAHRLEDVAFSLQETAFGMLVEVTERALAHTGKEEVLLGGGVACNARLREMVAQMCEDRGARSFAPEPSLCVDNGAMIAWQGILQHRAGMATPLAESVILPTQRTDDVPVRWPVEEARGSELRAAGASVLAHGAEAQVFRVLYRGRPAVVKRRLPKRYRHPQIDGALRAQRTRTEGRLLAEAKRAGVRTPIVFDIRPEQGELWMEELAAPRLREVLGEASRKDLENLLRSAGEAVARLHDADVVHGDLTTSNLLAHGDGVALLDFGLGVRSRDPEDKGTDLHVLMEALSATHAEGLFDFVLGGYRSEAKDPKPVEESLAQIVRRGRYRGT
ncbi:MAG TPA: bifunctional N(6)-L-threonylcarbamoyladenine synthase/serine/threonine protein kinase [Candidatus Thermoplasmatota archaeon]|nr:bifunctional N(6)-L-threonylcarbamoyladenine synthase/serine/threonine protein kinase [Candidatus Thermoplasmatota archaeon]